MQVLALESSSRVCSVALHTPGGVRALSAPDTARNSEVLLPMVRSLLAEAGIALGDLDGIAFGAGPGAFTGIRVACGAAQGLAFGADLPVVGVSSLDLLAEAVRAHDPQATHVLAALDARMGEVYWAALHWQPADADWLCAGGPLLARPEAVPLPAAHSAPWQTAGEAFTVYSGALHARLATVAWRQPEDMPALPDARALAVLGARRLARGLGVAAEHAQPLYVRDKVALTTLERAQGISAASAGTR